MYGWLLFDENSCNLQGQLTCIWLYTVSLKLTCTKCMERLLQPPQSALASILLNFGSKVVKKSELLKAK